MQGMDQKPVVPPILHPKQPANALNFSRRSGEEMPLLRVGPPGARIIREHLRRVVNGIEGDGEKNHIAFGGEAFAEQRKVIRQPETVIRKRTAGIDEAERDYLPAKR